MLQLIDICKSYTTADFTQTALDHVSVSFRDNEFVAVLGPSGSGKTTMLNIVGGLDHYDSGNLIIDGISTEQYKDRDWDAYRNNRIGFVFQSYNLIPHQTILANVELALTLSGVSRAERRTRATAALEEVGLGDHIHKKPSQLSGGQMQRVAIARALINDPEILLADEPTGALDSKTSVQVMDLLTRIANDRLVVMVTHNPELAEQYATRIVTLADGIIRSDTNPFEPTAEDMKQSEKPTQRTRMSPLTALALSFNNLMTKKGRTLMTAFAGSIGIIGIAAILALANGVNDYIKNVEEDTLSLYPLSIESTGFDLTSMMVGSAVGTDDSTGDSGSSSASSLSLGGQQASSQGTGNESGTVGENKSISRMFSSIGSNDLASLKQYLDSGESDIAKYANSIQYSYSVTPQIFSADASSDVRQVNPDKSFSALGLGSSTSSNSLMSMSMSTDVFSEMVDDTHLVEEQYDVVAGSWPQSYNDCVLVLSSNGNVTDFLMYTLGLRDSNELETMVKQFAAEEDVTVPDNKVTASYDDILNVTFKLVNATDYYQYDSEYSVWRDKTDDTEYMKNLVNSGEDLHISGIVQPKADAKTTSLSTGIYYTSKLTNHIIDQATQTQIVKDQLADNQKDVFTGKSFTDEEDEAGSSFDMSSLFTIDGNALQNAFTIDTSALNVDMSSLNLDLSSISIDASSLPAFDASALSIDPSSMDLSNVKLDLSGLDIKPDGSQIKIDNAKLSEAMAQVAAGFPAWWAEHPEYTTQSDAMNAYMESAEVQKILGEAIAGSIDTSGMQESIATQLQQQIGSQLAPALQQAIMTSLQTQLQTAMSAYMQTAMTTIMTQMGTALQTQIGSAMTQAMSSLSANMANAMHIDESAFASAFQMNMDQQQLTELMTSMMGTASASYDNNLKTLGYADYAKPASIDIYPVDFESKAHVISILDAYNQKMKDTGDEDKVITYTDIVGTLMSSVTDIVNMISYVLVAFVGISLVVSSIMIGVITYISVLERKKEIGILRSIGASKGDIGRVFNAETIIIGFTAGLIGIGLTELVCIPVNAIVYAGFNVANVAQLPWQAAIILIAISVFLTFLAGLIPSSAASRKDPVEALRSE